MAGDKSLEMLDLVDDNPAEGAECATVVPPKRSKATIRRDELETISAASPANFLVRVMRGERFNRALEEGGRTTAPCYPTLQQSVAAAELLLRKLLPDLRSAEVSGAEGGPIETRSAQISELSLRVAASLAAKPDDPIAALGENAGRVLAGLHMVFGAAEAEQQRLASLQPKALPSPASPAAVETAPGTQEIDFGDGLSAKRGEPRQTRHGPGAQWTLARNGRCVRTFDVVPDGRAHAVISEYIAVAKAEGVL